MEESIVKAIVNSTIGTLYNRASRNGETADEALYGMVVEILETEGNYCKVHTHYDYEGWMHKDDLLLDNEKAEAWEKEAKYVVFYEMADAMSIAEYAGVVLKTITRGGILKETGIFEGKWEKVILADGRDAWIRKNFAREIAKIPLEKEAELRKALIETAEAYLGTQYRWGGKSTLGIDCSGLTGISYMLNGYLIYRDAGEDRTPFMRKIPKAEAKAGDLIFFPGHVMMYLGHDRYIHSTGREGCVLYNSMNPEDPDYREDIAKGYTSFTTLW